MDLELASPADEPWIRQIPTLCGLPHEDLTPQHLRHFFVMKEKGQGTGVIGLEVLGRLALLRFPAIDLRFPNRELASQLTTKAQEYAASLEIN